MKISYFLLVILIITLPVFFTGYQVAQTAESSNQTPSYFETVLNASNNTLTSFDIENINLNQQGNLHICAVSGNSILYNDFSFSQLSSLNSLTFDNFKNTNLSTYNLNSSVTIQACQYYPNGNYNIFVIYYVYSNENYASIFVMSQQTNSIVNSKVISNISYYKTNKLLKFSNSNDLWIEMRNTSSFFILNVDNTNNNITKQFQSPIVNINSGYFSINDLQFSNDQLYVLFNKQDYSQSTNQYSSKIYIFSIHNASSSLQPESILSPFDYYSSITIQNRHLYALDELNSSVTEYDLTTFQPIDQIGIGNGYNNSLIRSFDDNNFIICTSNSVFELYSRDNTSNLIQFSKYLFALNFPQSANEEYTLELLNSNNGQSYFLAGYTQTNNGISGFALIFENINTSPNSGLINQTINLTNLISSSVSSSTPNDTIAVLVVMIMALIIIIGVVFIAIKGKDSSNKKEIDLNYNRGKLKSTITQETQKTCPVCGSNIVTSDVFCQNCGNKL